MARPNRGMVPPFLLLEGGTGGRRSGVGDDDDML